MSRAQLSALSVIAAIGIAVGIAHAAIPDASGTIHACYAPKSTPPGQVRVINAPSQYCKRSELPLTWNQQGPQGVPGAPGTPSVSRSAFAALQRIDRTFPAADSTPIDVLTLHLPAGTYFVAAHFLTQNDLDCGIYAAGARVATLSQAATAISYFGSVLEDGAAAVDLTNDGSVSVACSAFSNTATAVSFDNAQISAIAAAVVDNQTSEQQTGF